MTAEIIHFIPRPKRDREQTDFPAIAFRAPVPDGSAADHADIAQRKRMLPDWYKK